MLAICLLITFVFFYTVPEVFKICYLFNNIIVNHNFDPLYVVPTHWHWFCFCAGYGHFVFPCWFLSVTLVKSLPLHQEERKLYTWWTRPIINCCVMETSFWARQSNFRGWNFVFLRQYLVQVVWLYFVAFFVLSIRLSFSWCPFSHKSQLGSDCITTKGRSALHITSNSRLQGRRMTQGQGSRKNRVLLFRQTSFVTNLSSTRNLATIF